MAINYTTLKTELLTDPNGYGLTALFANGADNQIPAILNLVRDGTNGGPSITVKRADINANEILEAIDIRDIPSSIVQQQMSWFESATQAVQPLRLLNEDGTDTRVLANFKRILTNAQNSQTRLVTASQRNGSRAEQLFGTNTFLTTDDIAKARAA